MLPVAQLVVSDDSTDDRAFRRFGSDSDVDWGPGPCVGLGANRNAAIKRAHGSHVLFIDDDAELQPEFFLRIKKRLDELPATERDRAIVAGSERQDANTIFPNEQSFLGHQKRPYSPGDVLRTVVINGTVFPQRVFDQVRFDPQLVYGYDEVDFTTRAVAAGFVIHPCFEAYNVHRPSPNGRTYYQQHVEASRIYVTRKRIFETDGKRLRARMFMAAAGAHAFTYAVRTRGPAGVPEARRTLRLARRYWHTHRAL